MLCLPLVDVFTTAYNGLGGRLMFRVENSSLYSSYSLAQLTFAAASKMLPEHLEKPKSLLLSCPQSSEKKNYFKFQLIPYKSHVLHRADSSKTLLKLLALTAHSK